VKKDTSTNKPILTDLKSGTYFWCSCSKSETQPFCDGSHNGTKFTPVKKVISEDGKVAWCNCKITNEPPFCDGSHKKML
jgi:CDGSH-type Zn-finger protein